MSDELRSTLAGARFSGDRDGVAAIKSDPQFAGLIETARSIGAANSARRHFLSDAVRVDASLLPGLASAFGDIQRRAGIDLPMEAYVYCEHSVNASVLHTPDRMIVTLSSGAVERLAPAELDFVIGHELGHVAFGHLEVAVNVILHTQQVSADQAMRLLAWQRKGEISADRAGLLCCGSLEIAASSLFKTLSGLTISGVSIDPEDFAAQWTELAGEVAREAERDHWQASHPFPALRMKALLDFWRSDRACELIDEATGGRTLAEVDGDVESMLAMMDPLAREQSGMADPMLAPFLLWGGLYVASTNGVPTETELERLRSLVGRDALDRALCDGGVTAATCRQRFESARGDRRKPLSALELHRIFSALISVIRIDHEIGAPEVAALNDLAAACNVSPVFVESVLREAA